VHVTCIVRYDKVNRLQLQLSLSKWFLDSLYFKQRMYRVRIEIQGFDENYERSAFVMYVCVVPEILSPELIVSVQNSVISVASVQN
jgi:hypothetical protein